MDRDALLAALDRVQHELDGLRDLVQQGQDLAEEPAPEPERYTLETYQVCARFDITANYAQRLARRGCAIKPGGRYRYAPELVARALGRAVHF